MPKFHFQNIFTVRRTVRPPHFRCTNETEIMGNFNVSVTITVIISTAIHAIIVFNIIYSVNVTNTVSL